MGIQIEPAASRDRSSTPDLLTFKYSMSNYPNQEQTVAYKTTFFEQHNFFDVKVKGETSF